MYLAVGNVFVDHRGDAARVGEHDDGPRLFEHRDDGIHCARAASDDEQHHRSRQPLIHGLVVRDRPADAVLQGRSNRPLAAKLARRAVVDEQKVRVVRIERCAIGGLVVRLRVRVDFSLVAADERLVVEHASHRADAQADGRVVARLEDHLPHHLHHARVRAAGEDPRPRLLRRLAKATFEDRHVLGAHLQRTERRTR